jgi:1L-myo-inositol 1-phosphate cytidylyltransferase
MAGPGSRLRGSDTTFLKPLAPVLGRPMISYTIDALIEAGIRKIFAVVGFESERLSAAVMGLIPTGIEFCSIKNPHWEKQNGISLLAMKEHVVEPFLLTMSDHLFDQFIVDLLVRRVALNGVNLAVDRKVASVFDLDDAMKVKTRGDRVVAIAKDLSDYDAIDTGLFVCNPNIFDYLESAKRGGDCSLADGVRAMAGDGKVGAIDIGEAWWQDVDTPQMLAAAENNLRSRVRGGLTPAEIHSSAQT